VRPPWVCWGGGVYSVNNESTTQYQDWKWPRFFSRCTFMYY
jgi:hypothetical protein